MILALQILYQMTWQRDFRGLIVCVLVTSQSTEPKPSASNEGKSPHL